MAASAQLMHATAVARSGACVLLTGRSGSGKSDLALRLIASPPLALDPNPFVLVADDQVELSLRADQVYARAPRSIAGRIEVRGIGIVTLPFVSDVPVALAVELVGERDVERMPEPQTRDICGLSIAIIRVDANAASAPAKVSLALSRVFRQKSA